jgi:hypothetical protein
MKRTFLKTTIAVALVAGVMNWQAPTADAASRSEIKRIVIEEAQRSTVPPALALALAKVESDFQEKVRSHKGARGVMQIMPKTARDEFGVAADELWDPRLNVQLGIDFLEQLHEMYGGRWELALSHYNGGTLKGGPGPNARPHGYTRKYVANVMRWWKRYAEQQDVWGPTVVAAGYTPARTKTASLKVTAAERTPGEADPKMADGTRVEFHKTIIDDPDPNETGETHRQPSIVSVPALKLEGGHLALAPDAVPSREIPVIDRSVTARQGHAVATWGTGAAERTPVAGGFAERLAHARRSLDDFSAMKRRPFGS